jgi:hypothetical protein
VPKPPLVEVEWIDAVERDFTGTIPEAVAKGTLLRRFQVGYLVHRGPNAKGEQVVILAQTLDPPENTAEELRVDRLTVIPDDWVVALRYKNRRRRSVNRQAVSDGVPPAPSASEPSRNV